MTACLHALKGIQLIILPDRYYEMCILYCCEQTEYNKCRKDPAKPVGILDEIEDEKRWYPLYYLYLYSGNLKKMVLGKILWRILYVYIVYMLSQQEHVWLKVNVDGE